MRRRDLRVVASAAYNGLRNTAELVALAALAARGVLVALGARGALFLAGCGCAIVGAPVSPC